MTIQNRLAALRHKMREAKLDYYFVSNSDPHQNEYLPECWQRYQYISGFTGSNAEVLIGLEEAYFFTDGRYTEQAKIEVDPGLFNILIYAQGTVSNLDELIQSKMQKAKIGLDPKTLTIQKAARLSKAANSVAAEAVFLQENLIDMIWPDAPALPHQPILIYPEQYAGESAKTKIDRLQDFLKAHHHDALVLNDLPSIAWLLNLRGTDVDHNPVFLSYALVSHASLTLFVDADALSSELNAYLASLNITVKPYQDFYHTLPDLCPSAVLLDAHTSNQAILESLKAHKVTLAHNPIELWKACKNDTEIAGAKKAHEIDAVALIKFLSWLDQNKTGHTEVSLSEKLLAFRKQDSRLRGTSFNTIPGYAEHGAIIHYHATPETDIAVGTESLFLLDSGGQYFEGTTDITRTLHLGKPSAFEKECYTLVLKGHLALRRAIFPKGTRGEHLDAFARQFVWNQGINYGHGTGHGVGAYLCVHEGPQRISSGGTTTPLLANMILSNEPGLYLPGKFGIRIENLVFVKPAPIKDFGFGEFYTFEDLTLVPYALNLIDVTMLTEEEIKQVDEYHLTIWQRLHTQLDDTTKAWLRTATQALSSS